MAEPGISPCVARSIAAPFVIRRAVEADLPAIRTLIPEAFSVELKRPITGDASFAERFYAPNCKTWVAADDAKLRGVIFLTRWGSLSFFGPLCIEPASWGKGLAQRLVATVVESCRADGVAGLVIYTMPESPKHIHLYGKYGLVPRCVHSVRGVGSSVAQLAARSHVQVPNDAGH
jgi:N-acetylglutamate synthase-like GNAT family acetyltransferase